MPLKWRMDPPVEITGATSISLAFHRPGTRQRMAAIIGGCVLVLLAALAAPYAAVPVPEIASFMPAFGALTFGADLITAVLLFSHGQTDSLTGPGRLGVAYLFSVLVIVPHLAAFPGALAPHSLIGSSATAVWLWFAWHGGFGALVFFYALTHGRPERRLSTRQLVTLVTAAVVICVIVIVSADDFLPRVLSNTNYASMNRYGLGPIVVALNLAALLTVVFRLRGATTLHLWLAVAMVAANVDVVMTVLANARFTVGWYFGRACSLVVGLAVLLALLRQVTIMYTQLDETMRRLNILAHSDGLTGLANRLALDEVFERERRRSRIAGLPLSMLLLDIDFFKLFNDRYGHLAGDQCLRSVARQIDHKIRHPTDFAARFGGEEFVVVLPNTTRSEAIVIAERIRDAVHGLAIPHENSPLQRVTLSVGVATADRTMHARVDTSALLAAADAALYVSKSLGRNRVSEAA